MLVVKEFCTLAQLINRQFCKLFRLSHILSLLLCYILDEFHFDNCLKNDTKSAAGEIVLMGGKNEFYKKIRPVIYFVSHTDDLYL